jgi:hypothetical protein
LIQGRLRSIVECDSHIDESLAGKELAKPGDYCNELEFLDFAGKIGLNS